MTLTIETIAREIGAKAEGDLSLRIARPRQPDEAGPDDLALAMSAEFLDKLSQGQSRAAMVAEGTDWRALGLEAAVIVGRSRYAMAGLARLFSTPPAPKDPVHPSAVIDPTASLGEGVTVGPLAVIGKGVEIGANTRIEAQVHVGDGALIGADGWLMPGCRIGSGVTIGARFIGQMNAVIGGDGFSFVSPQPNAVEDYMERGTIAASMQADRYERIDSLGAVVIGDDVEVGACSVIDKGTVSDTRIGDGVKIDAHVMVGHNVQVDDTTLLCAQVGIAGSTRIGKRVVLGGRVGVADHISIGDDSIALAGSGVTTRVPERTVVMGYPALKQDVFMKIFKATRRLPSLAAKVAELQKRVPNDDDKG
ncbi:UDP-3-O-(3-hydroxymyristoyl)glucosamine N-acyltransferase [Roseobacter sp. HKCCA0434]|uniref:UDP-3-O-(3-hydroxymyristoyl)glucosamine N-acyltransferase n=1 Tax=Roseobacter sp. HKCCA0434 TaxID=3079297 RepID=UPI002905A1CE|nr:UDP-3-O-(3-hydroxymyristoyl)glucosamine N-acyltransferase [Roseobacter sp. HKCCA0434]